MEFKERGRREKRREGGGRKGERVEEEKERGRREKVREVKKEGRDRERGKVIYKGKEKKWWRMGEERGR